MPIYICPAKERDEKILNFSHSLRIAVWVSILVSYLNILSYDGIGDELREISSSPEGAEVKKGCTSSVLAAFPTRNLLLQAAGVSNAMPSNGTYTALGLGRTRIKHLNYNQ